MAGWALSEVHKSPITRASQGLKPLRGVSLTLSVPVPVPAGDRTISFILKAPAGCYASQ